MKKFDALDDHALIQQIQDSNLGLALPFAIDELAARALARADLLDAACAAISSDRRVRFHAGVPAGWLGADRIFQSGQREAISKLLEAMSMWEATEQEDLVSHWAGKGRLAELTLQLSSLYGWRPHYSV